MTTYVGRLINNLITNCPFQADDQRPEHKSSTPYSFIAMSTHGRSGIGRWVYGSIAERILVGASNPILLVRPTQKD